MTLINAPLRKLGLTLHIVSSSGWVGSVAAFLVLSIAGLSSRDEGLARASYLAMNALTAWVIVPMCFATLTTGVAQSLGTSWGLVRHYWVLVKLALTLVATVLLLLHTQPIRTVARAAAVESPARAGLADIQRQLVGDAAAALAALLTTTALSVYKPAGLTAYGWRRRNGRTMASAAVR